MPRIALFAAVAVLVAACATSPLGRSQLKLFPEDQMTQMGITAYGEMKDETQIATDPAVNRYVQCITRQIVAAIPAQYEQGWEWEVTVFADDQANAFALPGGKVGVYTGLLDVAANADQLATVIGHEIAHVLAGHSNERVSAQYATQIGLDLLQAAGGGEYQQVMGLLGLGAQVGILLPYSRKHESEADLLGLDLMAEAGFDPRESVDFWQRMQEQGGGAPPEFLSTHPSGKTRMGDLRGRMDRALQLYRTAQAQGRTPNCRKP